MFFTKLCIFTFLAFANFEVFASSNEVNMDLTKELHYFEDVSNKLTAADTSIFIKDIKYKNSDPLFKKSYIYNISMDIYKS